MDGEVALLHYFCGDIMVSGVVRERGPKVDRPNELPFRYQFAAGAVAGISEVESRRWFGDILLI